MARRKNQPEAIRVKYDLAERLRSVRTELFGERGGPELARRLGVPIRTWYNYESGVTVPSEVVLRFIELTSLEPIWLLHGQGPKYRAAAPSSVAETSSTSVESLLRRALEQLERREAPGGSDPPFLLREGTARGRGGLAGSPSPADAGFGAAADGEARAHGSVATLDRIAVPRAWLSARNEGRFLRMEGDAMAPVVADGALITFSHEEEAPQQLDGKLVVAWLEGQPLVRWFERSGHYGLLRAENAAFEPGMTLVDLSAPAADRRLRRVLWVGTPH